jgi:Uma2 family endonuclease
MTAVATAPRAKVKPSIHPLTVDQYDRMVELGILTENDRVELIDGYLVDKMPATPPHNGSVMAVVRHLLRYAPPGWAVLSQMGTRLAGSRPEPDAFVARGSDRDYFQRVATPADLGLVVEVSNSSLDFDQEDKARVYARDRIPVYWIVNLPERRVEVYTDPTGPGDEPRYATVRHFPAGTAVPVELDGQAVAVIPVDELLP